MALEHVGQELRKDEEILKEALKAYSQALKHASEEMVDAIKQKLGSLQDIIGNDININDYIKHHRGRKTAAEKIYLETSGNTHEEHRDEEQIGKHRGRKTAAERAYLETKK